MYFRSVRPVLGVALGIATLGLAYVFLIADYAHIARGIAAVTLSHGLHTVARGGVSATTCEAVQGGSLRWTASQNGLSVCTIVKNEAKFIREWVAFHRAQGVGYFVVWDDGSTDDLAAQLADHVASGLVVVYSLHDAVELVEARVALPAEAARHHRKGAVCAPTEQDVSVLRANAAQCISERAADTHVPCQYFAMRACGALAKLRGDAWMGVFDVDEFLWAPPGGVAPPMPAGAVDATTPLTAPGGLRAALDRAIARSLCLQVTVIGTMWGTSGLTTANWTGLVTATHTRHAPYDSRGYALPPPWAPGECPPLLCDTASPMKSFVLITPDTAVEGIALHSHMVGLSCYARHAEGGGLRYEHYSYLSKAEVESKKVVRNKNPAGSPAWAVLHNEMRADDYLNEVPDHVVARLEGALEVAMRGGG